MSEVAVKEDTNFLPENWVFTQIQEICEVNPRVDKKLISDDLKVSFVPMPAVKAESGVIDVSEEKLFSEVKKGFTPFQEGDVLFAKITPCMENGKMAVVPKVMNDYGFGSTEFHVLRASDAVDAKYIYYFVSSRTFRGHAQHNMSGAVGQKRVPTNYLKEHLIPLAPPEQQKRIVAKIEELFSHIDAGIAALNKAKQLLKQYRQSVLKSAVTGELTKQWREENKKNLEPVSQLFERILLERRQKWEAQQLKQFKAKGKVPKDDKWKGKYKEPTPPIIQDIPLLTDEWMHVRLDTIADVKGGLTVDSNRKKEGTKTLPYLRVANVQRGFLNLTKMKEIDVPIDKVEDFLLKGGDILFNEGGDRDKLGRGCVWNEEIKVCTYQNHVFRARPYSSEIISEFISVFGNTYGKEYFIKQGKQTTNLASINKTKLSGFPVPLCSIAEMSLSISLMDEKIAIIDLMLASVELQLLKAGKNKQSILASAFSGGLVH